VEDAFWVFRISYLYLTLVGFSTMVVVASLVTLVTGPNDPRKMRRDLLSPLVHRFLPPMDDTCDEKVAETLLVNETVSALHPRGCWRAAVLGRYLVCRRRLQPAPHSSPASCIRSHRLRPQRRKIPSS
jgi:hypothetical protein